MQTLDHHELVAITGGVTQGAPGTQKLRYREMCTVPDAKTARAQYDWMRAHEIPDASEAPGVKHRVVDAVGKLCGWK